MKRILALLLVVALLLSACNSEAPVESEQESNHTVTENQEGTSAPETEFQFEGTTIQLSDDKILVNEEAISTDASAAVYAANDIVYYEDGKDFTYGEGTEEDEHSAEEAAAHTVVHITQPGSYALSGKLSAGQIAIDLGEDAEEDPNAVVNLYLNGVDISCSVAPAVIFYNVYECGSKEEESATHEVDTTAAGANVYLVDGSENTVNGSYVARIYKSVELSEDGKSVVDSKKLHKYDAAFYSKKSMNLFGDTGVLNINAENEGLDSELHLTINGGNININSGNDGINTNEDSISVTTINGGIVNINVNGSTGEGDGIDSNGWLVINGGKVIAAACGFSGDAGIDSDMGIHVNGGTVIATGNMYDRLEEGGQNYAVFTFAQTQKGGQSYSFRNESGMELFSFTPANDFIYLILSDPDMVEGTYSFWQGDTQLASNSGGAMGFGKPGMMGQRPNMQMPEGMEEGEIPQMPPEGQFSKDMLPEGATRNEDGSITLADGTILKMEEIPGRNGMMEQLQKNEDGTFTLPDGTVVTQEELEQQMEQFRQEGGRGQRPDNMENGEISTEASPDFLIVNGANLFYNVAALN